MLNFMRDLVCRSLSLPFSFSLYISIFLSLSLFLLSLLFFSLSFSSSREHSHELRSRTRRSNCSSIPILLFPLFTSRIFNSTTESRFSYYSNILHFSILSLSFISFHFTGSPSIFRRDHREFTVLS